MTVVGYAAVSLFLLLLQTSVVPQIFLAAPFDILVVQIVFTGLTLSPLPGFVVVLFTGALADGLSGTPFGLHTTSYLWLFMMLQVAVQVLHVHSRALVYVAILVGTLLENLVAFFCLAVGGGTAIMELGVFHAGRQLVWAALLGPFLYLLLGVIYRVGSKGGEAAVARVMGGNRV